MALVEVARFTDVYEADLAAAFLASLDLFVEVTERFQTTVDPLMQRALGIRLLVPEEEAKEARSLLDQVRAGAFASAEDDEPIVETSGLQSRAATLAMGLLGLFVGMSWGPNRPRRLRHIHSFGLWLVAGIIVFGILSGIVASVWSVIEMKMFYAEFLKANG